MSTFASDRRCLVLLLLCSAKQPFLIALSYISITSTDRTKAIERQIFFVCLCTSDFADFSPGNITPRGAKFCKSKAPWPVKVVFERLSGRQAA